MIILLILYDITYLIPVFFFNFCLPIFTKPYFHVLSMFDIGIPNFVDDFFFWGGDIICVFMVSLRNPFQLSIFLLKKTIVADHIRKCFPCSRFDYVGAVEGAKLQS